MYRSVRWWVGGWVLGSLGGVHGQPRAEVANDVPSGRGQLDRLVQSYFQTVEDEQRRGLVAEIRTASGNSVEQVAASVRAAKLWSPLPVADFFSLPTKSAETVKVWWRGFKNPAPDRARPLVLCLPDVDEMGHHDLALERAITSLGPAFCEGCFLAVLDRPIGGGFHQHPQAARDLRAILREARRNLPLDGERVFLFGRGRGGEAAWTAAMFNPDLFAGVITVASVPRLPYAEQLLPILLPNLSHTPLLGVRPLVTDPQADPTATLLDARLSAIETWSRGAGLPVRGAPTPFVDSPHGKTVDGHAIRDDLTWLENALRPRPGVAARRSFRYLGQGDLGWLRASKLYGDVWTDDQLSILPSPGADRDAFITDVLQEKLFFLAGRVVGQTVTIATKRIAEVELRLFDGMVDFSQPVTVVVNARKRHDAVIQPDMATLLESAYAEWEFQRLVFATLSFSIAPDRP